MADKDIPEAIYHRVLTNKVTQGKGKQKRVRYVCKGSLHSGNNNDNKLDGYTRAQKVFLVDPRGADEAGLLNVRKEFMDIFIERKRKKESDNLRGTDSEESDGECVFCHPCLLPGSIIYLRSRVPVCLSLFCLEEEPARSRRKSTPMNMGS